MALAAVHNPQRDALQRAAVLVRGDSITAEDLSVLEGSPDGCANQIDWPEEDLPSAVARLEELLIRRALARSAGNRTDAARILNINRQLLYAKLKRYGLAGSEVPDARDDADTPI